MKLNPANIERKGFKELSGPNRLILKGAFNCYLWGKYHCSSYPWNHDYGALFGIAEGTITQSYLVKHVLGHYLMS